MTIIHATACYISFHWGSLMDDEMTTGQSIFNKQRQMLPATPMKASCLFHKYGISDWFRAVHSSQCRYGQNANCYIVRVKNDVKYNGQY